MNHLNRPRISLAFLLTLALGAAVSCSHDDPAPADQTESGRGDRQAARVHAVQESRIRTLMQQMASGKAAGPTDLPSDPEAAGPTDADKTFSQGVRLGKLLAEAAIALPGSVADRDMSTTRRAGFAREADNLRRYAMEFREASLTRNVEQMQRALERVDATCTACHTQYREISGELDRPSVTGRR